MGVTFVSFGGAGAVTGSRHLIECGREHILTDCGMFQGLKVLRERNWEPFPAPPESISSVVLTHAHLDHCGYLPKFVREGFAGRIHCTRATADLAEILLKDSAHIAEKDAEYANRKGFSRHQPALPLYTVADAERALQLFDTAPFDTDVDVAPGVKFRFRRAGHILGAAIVEYRVDGLKIVFSGDLGRYGDPFMHDPQCVASADYVVVESTYGDRLHPKEDAMDALGDAIERTVQRGGTVIIPAFAVGRAQILLYHLWRLRQSGRLGSTPVYLDSPMAIDATDLLARHPLDHRFDAGATQGACRVAAYARDVRSSKEITANPMPKVVIAGSGMATGGRVLHHIRTFAPDPRNLILFTGFQAPGTRGARLLAGERELKMFGEWVPIRAEIADLPQLSAHADADELMRWLRGFDRPPRRLFIVHGEPIASEALRTRVQRELEWDVRVVDPMRRYRLD
ncbi:MAG: MBL fold metallo-hydrolase RNA specificity domain-containing protein [Hyphomonadaceae bacterium]